MRYSVLSVQYPLLDFFELITKKIEQEAKIHSSQTSISYKVQYKKMFLPAGIKYHVLMKKYSSGVFDL